MVVDISAVEVVQFGWRTSAGWWCARAGGEIQYVLMSTSQVGDTFMVVDCGGGTVVCFPELRITTASAL